MGGKRKATTWAELETLPTASRESLRVGFMCWTDERFAPDLAHYWPMTEGRVRGTRSPHGFTQRSLSGWPECWFEHGWVRDCLLTAYVWDQEIATGKEATAGADRAAYQEHVRNVVVPEVQHIAQMCALGHVDPRAQLVVADPWEPDPPPLPGEPTLVVIAHGVDGMGSPQDAAPLPDQQQPAPTPPRHPLAHPATSSPEKRTASALGE
jgi:hypothetical protein